MLERIKELSEEIENEVIGIYKHLHENPELSFKEFNTSKYIKDYLDKLDIHYENPTGTSIVAHIKGENTGKTIALRCDMDALPIEEESTHKICSKNKGVMHACGHDIHMAALLGTAKILNTIKDSLKGNILLVFQSGEELLPGGAKGIIETGIFKKQKAEWIGAFHCDPGLPIGTAGFKEGMYMASGDEIFISIEGEGGHAAMPHLTADTILIASEIIVALQQINSRHCPPSIPSVLTFGRIIGNGAVNIIPKEVKIDGTFRTMNEEWRAKAKGLIKKISKSIAESHGVKCTVNIIDGYPFLTNNAEYTRKLKEIAISHLGEKNILDLDIRMTTEDFAYYSQVMKSTFFRLGVGENNKKNHSLHTSHFIADYHVLKIATSLLSDTCTKLL